MDKYISKYSNGKTVSSAQYITEIICENKARIDGKDLHYRFWVNKEWSKFYRNQIATANQLTKKYSPKAIIAALKDPKCYKTYSLRSPILIPIIEKYQELIDSQNTEITIDLDRNKKTYKKDKQNVNIISKLKDLDDDKN